MQTDTIRTAPPAINVSPLGEVETAFMEWKATRNTLNASTEDDGTESPEHPIWAQLKRAEETIQKSSEVGPRVAEIRLWLSITGDLIYARENDAMHREDANWLLANADEPEFATIMALRQSRHCEVRHDPPCIPCHERCVADYRRRNRIILAISN